jgi:hypothetical protein
MDSLEITDVAQEHPVPEGTKIVIITDGTQNHARIDFEADANFDTSPQINCGKNAFQVPEGRDSFSVIALAPYSVGVDYLAGGDAGDTLATMQAQLADHETRITALEDLSATN